MIIAYIEPASQSLLFPVLWALIAIFMVFFIGHMIRNGKVEISCQKCGQTTERAGYPTWVFVVAILFFPLGLLALLAGRKPTECSNCRHIWQA